MGRGFAWEGITVGFSKTIELSTKFVRGQRDSRIHFEKKGPYRRMMDIAETINVVIYDASERISWLLNGTSALLLLVRTALTSPFAVGAGDDPERIGRRYELELSKLPGNATAKQILSWKPVYDIPLYEDDEDPANPWRLKQLVLEQWKLIDEMRSHQMRIQTAGYHDLHLHRPHSRVEGFDFFDMISYAGPLRPKYTDVGESLSWPSITSKFNAVTII